MKILINKDIFEDIQLFKKIVEYVLDGKSLLKIKVNSIDNTLRFDFEDVIIECLTEQDYYEISIDHLRSNLDFALEIEKGNYPDC